MNLLAFLSDRCNMACDYCFLALNQGPARVLALDAGRRAVDDFLSRFPEGRVTLLGGEPLVHFDLACALAAHARAGGRSPRLRLVTNGTLLDTAKVVRLAQLGVELVVSLDGEAASHDAHRKLLSKPEASAREETLAALAASGAAPVQVNLVVCEDTAGRLLSNVEALRSRGLRRISIQLNVTEAWSEAGLAALRRSLAGFARYAESLPEGALDRRHLACLAEGALAADHGYDDLVLGADGRYYPCDGLLSLPYPEAAAQAVGDAFAGVDWAAREARHAEARAFIHARLGGAPHLNCPREAYFRARAAGRDPGPAVDAFHAADRLLAEGLSRLGPPKGELVKSR